MNIVENSLHAYTSILLEDSIETEVDINTILNLVNIFAERVPSVPDFLWVYFDAMSFMGKQG